MQEKLRKMQLYRPFGRRRTCGPAILVQRSNQLSYRGQLSSSNRKFMFLHYKQMPMKGVCVNIRILFVSFQELEKCLTVN